MIETVGIAHRAGEKRVEAGVILHEPRGKDAVQEGSSPRVNHLTRASIISDSAGPRAHLFFSGNRVLLGPVQTNGSTHGH